MSIDTNKDVIKIRDMIKNCKELIDEKEKLLVGYYKKLADILHSLDATNDEIRRNITTKVSDHALLRYLERYYKIDMEKMRAEIMTPIVEAAIKAGAKTVKVHGIAFVLRDNTIVTSLIEKDIVNTRRVNSKKYLMNTDKKINKDWKK